MSAARRLASIVWVSLGVLTGMLVFASAPALAFDYHKYEMQITEVPSGKLSSVNAMTSDSGDLYISGGEELEGLYKFDALTGAFVSQLSLPGFVAKDLSGIAFGHHTGETELYGAYGLYKGASAIPVFGAGVCGSPECPVLQAEWNGMDTPNESFVSERGAGNGFISSIAVDESKSAADWAKGDVFVETRGDLPNLNVVDVFKPEAKGGEKYTGTRLLGPSPSEPFERPMRVAVSGFNGDVLVLDERSGGPVVDVFEPAGMGEYTFVRALTVAGEPFSYVEDVAVDAADGEIYVAGAASDNGSPAERAVYELSASGELVGEIGGGEAPGGFAEGFSSVGVDPDSGDVFAGVIREEEGHDYTFIDMFGHGVVVPDVVVAAAGSVKAGSVVLSGTVNPDEAGAATCEFAWGTSRSLGHTVACSEAISASEGKGDSPLERHVELTGLQPDTTYYFRLQATNANGTNSGKESQDQVFTTSGPGVREESASSVTSSSVTLNAELDPDGAPTSYYFQYGASASYGESVPLPPGVQLGSGSGYVGVSVHLQGLGAGTVYHYRVVAVGESGGEVVTDEGSDQTFTTQAAGSELTLADGRVWELVTPPDKQGAEIYMIGKGGGDDIQVAQSGDGITFGTSGPFTASPEGSDSPEVTQVISLRDAPGVWSTQDIATPHNEGATEFAIGHSAEYKLFSGDLSLGAVEPTGHMPLPPLSAGSEKTVYMRKADGGYEALVSAANVPAGCQFGGNGEGAGGVEFVDGTPDMRHVVLGVSGCVSPGAVEWSEGKLAPIGVLPDREVVGGALAGVRRAISSDGSRVAWTTAGERGQVGTLYLRDMASGETVLVGEKAVFQLGDGAESRVFFTSGGSLEVFEVTSGSGEPLAGRSTKLVEGGGEKGRVDGVIGAGEDGSDVYFVDSGVLGDGGEHGAESGGDNLYVDSYDEAARAWAPPVFIALLSGEDAPSWDSGGDPVDLTSRVSPNGRFLAFMSEQSLTGYENRDASSGVRDEEVFLYDADTGRVVCASCDPTGARPLGIFKGPTTQERLIDNTSGLWDDRWLAANVPGWTTENAVSALYQSRYLSDSGRLFFDGPDALVPADVNGREDVYEYEPAGVGSCQAPGYGQSASVVFVEGEGGCVGLISAGTSSEESAFMDASESGGDVFFVTLSRLSLLDVDTSMDIYDAHECTVEAPCAPPVAVAPPACATADSCKAAPLAQPAIFGAPASATFTGVGNVPAPVSALVVTGRSLTRAQKLANALRACRRDPKRKRAVCERRARGRYGARSARVRKILSTMVGR
jgi:hypothetical protein